MQQIQPSCGWCDGRNLGAGLGAFAIVVGIIIYALSGSFLIAASVAVLAALLVGFFAAIMLEFVHDCGSKESPQPVIPKAMLRRRRR